jgi:transcriptional regulator with XRE-family HTH domain
MRKSLRGRFREEIRAARLAAGYTTREIQRGTGLPYGYLAMIEGGHRPPPSPGKILALARFLGLNPYRLFIKAGISHTVGPLIEWLQVLGIEPEGCRLLLLDRHGDALFDVALETLDGEYAAPGEEEMRAFLERTERDYGQRDGP